jgi:hypothetical protein
MKTSKTKQLTLEQIAKKYKMSISEVNSNINNTYNKIVDELISRHHVDIWDAVVQLKLFFGMSEKEAFDKLSVDNKELLKKAVTDRNY